MIPPHGSGMPSRHPGMAGPNRSSASKSKAMRTSGRAKPSPTSRPPCRQPIQTWQRRCSKILICSIFSARRTRVEQALVDHIQRFLLELGAGFAFMGRQVPLEVGSQDYYLDLLFYHVKLRSYVVVELKAVPFDPAFVGQMNLYLSAVDDLLRHPDDKPSIGLLLCKEKNKITVEYALRDLKKPIGVAAWRTRLVESLPKRLKGQLPSIKQIEKELGNT